MLALIWSMQMSLPYTDSSQGLVGMSMGSGGSWQTTGKRLGQSTKVSTFPKIVCQPGQPFLPMVLFELLCQSCWTVAESPVPKQPNDTDATNIPEMHIVAVISYMFTGG